MLFDDNLGFFGFAVPKNMKISSDSDLTSIADGFSKGNMFNNLYDPYKNYKYERVVANNKQEELLLEIMALSFAINDLNLYLDLHPTDQTMLALFNDYKNEADKLTKEYEARYGPLTVNSNSIGNSTFNWVMSWPWEESK